MAIANQKKQEILESIMSMDGKYSKPFTEGRMSGFSVFGGSWNEYAAVVLDMIIADTLLNIERKLTQFLGTKEHP